MEAEYAPEPASAPAIEGTRAHNLLEACLINNIDTDEYVPLPIGDLVEDDDGVIEEQMLIYVQQALDRIREVVPELRRYEIITERRVEFEDVIPDPEGSGGTIDVCWYDNSIDVLYMWDLKYGYIIVDAYENAQLQIGAHGFMRAFQESYPRENIKQLRLSILQPRKALFDTFETAPDKVREWTTNEVTPKVQQALGPREGLVFNPTQKNCEFCLARHDCRARTKWIEDTALAGFNEIGLSMRDMHAMSDAELGEAYLRSLAIAKWAEDIKEKCQSRVKAGKLAIEGYEIRESRGAHRIFKGFVDDDTIIDVVGVHKQVLYEPAKRKTLSQIEKLLPKKKDDPEIWKQWQTLVHKPPGALVLMPVRGGKPAVDPTQGFSAQPKPEDLDEMFG